MSESDYSDTTEQVVPGEPIAFGERLHRARQSQGLSVNEVAKAIKLSSRIVDAIDRSDTSDLPPPTYVQGYLKAYAKHVGVAADFVLEEYAKAVPHVEEPELVPTSSLTPQTDSGSPAIIIVTALLGLIAFAGLIYGAYSYYSNTLASDGDTAVGAEDAYYAEPENAVDAFSDEPLSFGQELDEWADERNASQEDIDEMTETDGDAQLLESDSSADVEQERVEQKQEQEATEPEAVENESINSTETSSVKTASIEAQGEQVISRTEVQVVNDNIPATDGSVELLALQASWVEVIDANGESLYYNLVPVNQLIKLEGASPFDIFLGNAPAVEIKVNGVKIDVTRYVRNNNIAHFKVSVRDGQPAFY